MPWAIFEKFFVPFAEACAAPFKLRSAVREEVASLSKPSPAFFESKATFFIVPLSSTFTSISILFFAISRAHYGCNFFHRLLLIYAHPLCVFYLLLLPYNSLKFFRTFLQSI